MATNSGILLNPQSGFQAGSLHNIVDASLGGQNGPAPQIGKYVQNAADVNRSWQARVIDFPRWTYLMPDAANWQRAIKAMVETHAIITGINFGLTADYLETQIGYTEKIQYDAGRSVEQQSAINMSLPDKFGQYFYRLLTTWIRLGHTDPHTGRPGIAAINPNVRDALPDLWSMSTLFYSTDAFNRNVINAVYITNMGPRSDGAPEGWRDHTRTPQLNEMSIDWTGLQDTGYGVLRRAQEDLEKSKLFGLQPDRRAAWFEGASPAAAAAVGGRDTVIEDIINNTVR